MVRRRGKHGGATGRDIGSALTLSIEWQSRCEEFFHETQATARIGVLNVGLGRSGYAAEDENPLRSGERWVARASARISLTALSL